LPIVLLTLAYTKMQAQAVENTIVWNSVQLPVKLSTRWQMANDVSYRTLGFSTSAFQYTFRTGLRYRVNDKWRVAAGVALFNTRTSFNKTNTEFGTEYRGWQEAQHELRILPKTVVQNRLRIEERFFAATLTASAFQAVRARYRLALIQSIHQQWQVQLFNEYMQQWRGGAFAFQQNRLGITGMYNLNTLTQLQAGYIWSTIVNGHQHFITLTFLKNISIHGNNSTSQKK
jgi:hypothetical protein